MAYLGEHLYSCRSVPFDWNRVNLVVVSGTGPNFCGHAVVNAGNYYFHIDGPYDYPWYMNEPGFRRYLKENGKTELRRVRVPLPNPLGAQRKLEDLSARKWLWAVLPHNCASYVEEFFSAGGSKVSSLANCPVLQWQ
jgi:hypothetical protein